MMNEKEDEEFVSRDVATKVEWYLSMKDWVKIAIEFNCQTEVMTQIMLENFAFASAFKSNRNII
jgi:hypothetical protein